MSRPGYLQRRPERRPYAALMTSQPGRSRIHIRPAGYLAARVKQPSAWNTLPTIARQECFHPRSTASRNAAAPPLKRNTNVKLVEPPSCSCPSTIVFIGRNSRGQWVAQEQNGLFGGLFVSRAQAVKYALFENGHHPETIVELSRGIELDMGGSLAGSRQVA